MKRLVVVPDGWPCPLSECRPGLFMFQESLCMKSDYGPCEAFNEAGERFWGGTNSMEELREVQVQPVTAQWEEYDADGHEIPEQRTDVLRLRTRQ